MFLDAFIKALHDFSKAWNLNRPSGIYYVSGKRGRFKPNQRIQRKVSRRRKMKPKAR